MARKYAFGHTPWGAYFIQAMELLADAGRLGRGRSYAGKGSVTELRVEGGAVRAKVSGNYRPFYTVQIRFPEAGPATQAALQKACAADPLLAHRLERGELPEGFIDGLRKAGGSLLPRRWSEMKRSCNCPDYGDPCKHQAAVYYILAQEIDRDPRLIFSLRGLALPAAAGSPPAIPSGPAPGAAGVADANGDRLAAPVLDPLDIAPARAPTGWAGGALPYYGSLILSLLPPSAGLCPFDLKERLAEFQHGLARSVALGREARNAGLNGEGGQPSWREDARQRAWLYGSPSLRVGPGGEAFVLDPEGKALRPWQAALALPRVEAPDAGGGYRFLRAFFSALEAIAEAAAMVPALRCDGKSFSAVWKPARMAPELDALLSALEPSCALLLDDAPKAAPPKTSGKKAASKKASAPDARRAVEALAQAYLSELAFGTAYQPKGAYEAAHPVLRALFLGQRVPCVAPGERGLPAALHAWLASLDAFSLDAGFELSIAAPKAAQQDDAGLYALKAGYRDASGRKKALYRAGADERGHEARRFALLLSNYLPELYALATRDSVELPGDQLAAFVLDAEPVLRRLGVAVALPKELRKLARPAAALRARRVPNQTSYLDLNSAFSYDWQVAIDGQAISPADFARLVADGKRLARWMNAWVRIDPAEAARILARLKEQKAPGLLDAIQASLEGELLDEGGLSGALSFLKGEGSAGERALPGGLDACLRPYQERGYRWLAANAERGLGCLLADDMGLGKTLQAIALLLELKQTGRLARGALVCAPASLLDNWERELARFAPSLSVRLRETGARRGRQPKAQPDVLLVSYEAWLRDAAKHEGRAWDLVVLDEAHYIKNPSSKRALAVKAIPAAARLALTGTPVENNLAELWSVFDFALPGYLGSLAEFSARFRTPVERDADEQAAARLRRLCAPFMLRRLKTDPAIAADLPDKVVIDEYASLEPAQAALYAAVSGEGLDAIRNADGENRLGLVLALITALKQVSNHPRNYDQDGPAGSAHSGKARLLTALLGSAFEAGERVLVFSQYVRMLDILAQAVRDELGVEPYLLHGGMSAKKRTEQVDRFQSERGPGVFLISLKAGGVGLNLTAASRVIHYDLWFNPSVENQATDRAFRIGQKRNVFVHRLITRGTLEERIDAMIKAKRELSELTVRAGESWLGDLSDAELKELVSLG